MHVFKMLRYSAVLIAAGAVLTGCTINIGGETTDAADDTAASETITESDDANTDIAAAGNSSESEPVIPPLGEFNRSDADYVQFKPCLEIPDEFLEKAGLYGKEMMEGVGEVDGICTFAAEPEHGTAVFNVQGSRHDFETHQSTSGEITWDETSFSDPILIHRDEYLPDSACEAVVETIGGTFSITFQSFEYGNENYQFDPCVEAQKKLKTVLELDGKHEA